MKRNFWLILAVLSLLGMIIMPGTAHSAVIAVPATLPTISSPRITLPNYPVPLMGIRQLQGQLSAPRLRASLVPVSAPAVMAVAPAVMMPRALTQAPVMEAPPAPVFVAPQSAIPSSRIEGIAASRRSRKNAGAVLARMAADNKGSRLPSPAKIAALFDGAAKPEPAAVPAGPERPSPTDASEDTSLTLPESDLAEEIGLGY